MQNTHPKSLFFGALFAAAMLFATPAEASRPGGGYEGPPTCTVMGKVVRIEGEIRAAVVKLLEIAGSSTSDGCLVTGAAQMVEKKTEVRLMVDSTIPSPAIGQGDVAFVVVKDGGAVEFQLFMPSNDTLEQLLTEVQVHFDNRLQRLKFVYAIRSFLDLPVVIDALVTRISPDTTDKERRLGAALMLIVLAQDKQAIPPDALQTALKIGLMESRKTTVGSSIKLFPADPYQVVNQLSVMLRDKEGVPDPFATIVALGEMGNISTRAVGDIIDRMNDSNITQVRAAKEEKEIFQTAVEKMKGEDDAAKHFMKRVDNKELKDPIGPLAEGMCALKGGTDAVKRVLEWCKWR